MVTARPETGAAGAGVYSPPGTADDPGMRVIWELLEAVKDPEIPVLSIFDLGILRAVEKINDKIIVTITPTYSGCPAMHTIVHDIQTILTASGYVDSEVKITLAPAWTTDWMSAAAKQKLEQAGIAPPGSTQSAVHLIHCPLCKSGDTKLISEFGATACKSIYQCNQCQETFCYFKAI